MILFSSLFICNYFLAWGLFSLSMTNSMSLKITLSCSKSLRALQIISKATLMFGYSWNMMMLFHTWFMQHLTCLLFHQCLSLVALPRYGLYAIFCQLLFIWTYFMASVYKSFSPIPFRRQHLVSYKDGVYMTVELAQITLSLLYGCLFVLILKLVFQCMW